jgi:hypothetical protein
MMRSFLFLLLEPVREMPEVPWLGNFGIVFANIALAIVPARNSRDRAPMDFTAGDAAP